jgi:hypothetical protein
VVGDVVRILFGKIIQLVFGGLIGCVVGGIITGNENYWIALAIGFPLLLTVLGIFGARGVRQRQADGAPVPLRQGIISTIPGMRPTPLAQPVLNPVSTAQPTSGVVLNGEAVKAPEPARPPRWWRVLSIATIVAGAVLVLLPSHQSITWFASDIAAGRPFDGRDMISGRHQQDAFDQLAGVMGGSEVISISFFADSIQVSAPSSPGARTIDRYQWQAGIASNLGPDFSQPSDPLGELFDAGDIDMDLVATLVRESLDDARLEDVQSVYPSIRRPDVGEDPVIGIPISGAYFSAYYSYSVTGELIQRTGTAFE